MKIKLVLSMALGLAGASSLVAGTVDVYLTGSTAFRASVYTACSNLFVGGPSIYYGDAAHGGANSGFSTGTASWVMTGTPVSTLTNLQGNTLVVHGLFTGSIQGIQTTVTPQALIFPVPHGTINGNADQYVTNTPTIGFSDSSATASPYPLPNDFTEEQVAVQPFVIAKSITASGAVTNINNVSWEQLEYGIPQGRIPLSAWTGKMGDTNNFVYLVQRTKDSGTRRTETQGEYYQFNDPVGVFIYDTTTNGFFTPTVLAASSVGTAPNGVVGPAGLNNANLNWGYGYVGGGDIKNALNINNTNDQAIAVLSIADAKGVNNGGGNWSTVVSFNGFWPTAAGAGLHGNNGTNDYSPITLGYYPIWGFEVIVYEQDPSKNPNHDQDISATQLGNQLTPGSFLGVFNAQTAFNGGSPIVGSIEREIAISEPGGATAIRLSEMVNLRPNVGGLISPPFN